MTKKSHTMLIVDDIRMSRALLCEVFCDSFNILEASDGFECIEIVKANADNICIIILDLVMPNMNGLQVLEEIQKEKNLAKIPIIVVTGNKDIETEVECLKHGATDIISKPFDNILLKQRVSNIMMKKALVEERLLVEVLKKKSEAQIRLQAIMDNIPGGICILEYKDPPVLTFFNEAMPQLLGYTHEEFEKLIKDDFTKCIFPIDISLLHYETSQSIAENKPLKIEFRFKTKDGGISWTRLSATQFSENSKVPCYYCVFIDVNKEKENEILSKRAFDELEYRQTNDELTGLYNQAGFYKATTRLISGNPNTHYVLINISIENINIYIDIFGAEAGRLVLLSIADYSKAIAFGSGTFGRLSDTHFIICMPRNLLAIDRILFQLNEKLKKLETNFDLFALAGLYEIKNTNISIEKMCDYTRIAYQEIDRDAGETTSWYDNALSTKIMNEQNLYNQIPEALEKKQFEVYYQPIFDYAKNKIVCAEALVRWNHPSLGLIKPYSFLNLFTKNGIVNRLDQYIIESVLCFLNKQKEKGYPVLPVSLNISNMNIIDKQFADNIERLLENANIEPSQIYIEVNDESFSKNSLYIIQTIKLLRDKGFKVMLDNFGNGKSGLLLFNQISIDYVKINVSFLRGLNIKEKPQKIYYSLSQLAKNLGIEPISECIEKKDEAEFIFNSTQNTLMQGAFFSPPLGEKEYEKLLSSCFEVKI